MNLPTTNESAPIGADASHPDEVLAGRQRTRPGTAGSRDRGDTLIEILVAVSVIGMTGVALLGAFASAIGGSVSYRHAATLELVLKDFAEFATVRIQSTPSPLFQSCAPVVTNDSHQVTYAGTPLAFTVPTGYTISGSIAYLNGTGFTSTCTPGSLGPQLITASATSTVSGATLTLSFVVIDPGH